MKIFVDECIDWRLSRHIDGHDVKTARQMGWTEIRNGELLRLASREFDVFLTVDRNLPHQQNLAVLDIIVVVLRAHSSKLADVKVLVPELLEALPSASPGTALVISAK